MGIERVGMWMAAGVMGLGLLGCGMQFGEKESKAPPAAPQPVNVTVAQAPPAVVVNEAPPAIVVREAPPAIVVEQRPATPGEGHVFIDGYHHWDGSRYGWVSGRWMRPPQPAAVWVAPVYEKTAEGYRYVPGHWHK